MVIHAVLLTCLQGECYTHLCAPFGGDTQPYWLAYSLIYWAIHGDTKCITLFGFVELDFMWTEPVANDGGIIHFNMKLHEPVSVAKRHSSR